MGDGRANLRAVSRWPARIYGRALVNASIDANSSPENDKLLRAPTFSSICSGREAPINALVTPGNLSIHAVPSVPATVPAPWLSRSVPALYSGHSRSGAVPWSLPHRRSGARVGRYGTTQVLRGEQATGQRTERNDARTSPFGLGEQIPLNRPAQQVVVRLVDRYRRPVMFMHDPNRSAKCAPLKLLTPP